MKRINTTDVCRLVFAVFLTTAILLIGCGGGGGSGRQTLPGENPAGPIVIPGTGTDTNTYTGTNTGTGTDIMTPAEMIQMGWSVMNDGNYGGGISYFTNALNDSSITAEQRQEALNGRGWAKVNYYSTIEGLEDFKQSYQLGDLSSSNYKESILGYALSLIQATGDDNLDRAIQLLANELELAEPTFVLGIEHTCIGVTSPEAHAMLAYAYSWRGYGAKAKAQILQARIDDPSTTDTVHQIYETLRLSGAL